MLKLRRSDTVYVTTGKDKGKKGKVLKLFAAEKRAIIEGVNLVKKHKRRTQQDQQGGVVAVESPLSISNLMVVCKHCGKPVRVGIKDLEDGTRSRYCKRCKEVI
ncbi:MAG: 50S ribosomal protein L24 [Candidatus Omnitrophica bacterium]|jgi:large subunit ribosomal protein L24|nr:50S ribosomal protein L24 [Candidatus Omnitrophota bacterium]MDD5654097.1 50S ribosomal protein L24 [Candidatus Omnitrophota bacterium]